MTNEIKIRIDTSDEAMVGGFGWGDNDPDASTEQYLDNVIKAVKARFPDYAVSITKNDHVNEVEFSDNRDEIEDWEDIRQDTLVVKDIISDVYQEPDWYVEDTEAVEAKAMLNSVMTAAEACNEFGLSESTVRQAINRGTLLARKSSETWLVLRRDVVARWGNPAMITTMLLIIAALISAL